MKLINAEFAISVLKKQFEEFSSDTLISWLENISCECEPITWFKLEERSPKEYGIYLVTINYEYVITAEYFPDTRGFLCGKVVAWAHLPKPYKGEK